MRTDVSRVDPLAKQAGNLLAPRAPDSAFVPGERMTDAITSRCGAGNLFIPGIIIVVVVQVLQMSTTHFRQRNAACVGKARKNNLH